MNPALLSVLLMLLAGYACARSRVFLPEHAEALHRFVIYVCLPALIWRLVPTLRWEPGLWVIVLVPWLLVALMAALILALARAFVWPRPVCGALLLCVPLGNTSFLGFPLIAALRGEGAVRYAVLYDQLGSFLGLATYGLFVSARFGGGPVPTPAQSLLRVVRFPPFIALALAFTPLARIASLQPLLARLGDALVPLAMFAVGLRIELRPPRPFGALLAGLALKLLLMPALAFLITARLAPAGLLRDVVVLEAGMPAMITAGALAILFDLAPELAAALVGYGVLLALGSLPLWAAWLRGA